MFLSFFKRGWGNIGNCLYKRDFPIFVPCLKVIFFFFVSGNSGGNCREIIGEFSHCFPFKAVLRATFPQFVVIFNTGNMGKDKQ